MTAAEWRESWSPTSMLATLGKKASKRKLRLFLAACCRRVAGHLTDSRFDSALAVAEQFADSAATAGDLADACHSAHAAAYRKLLREVEADAEIWRDDYPGCILSTVFGHPVRWSTSDCAATAISEVCCVDPLQFADDIVYAVLYARDPDCERMETSARIDIEKMVLADLLRDIFGNRFRRVSIDKACLTWRDGTIPKLAQAAYEERELPSGHLNAQRLMILADALEEAGCKQEVLAHLRGHGPHVRGCWAVDLVLKRR